ncbi:hypothetical protein AAHC03_04842 [Spirometra sp. Aus1]
MRAKGETLNSDQEKALLDYDMVSCSVTVIKEMVDSLAELQVKLDEAFETHEKEALVKNEEYAVDSLQRLSAIWGLLSKLQSPSVKAAIIKASSSQQFVMLDNLTKMINMPLPEPKAADAFSQEFDALLKSNAFKEQASILLGLAIGRPVPISNAKGSKLRGQTFEDVRTMCLNLLSNPDVRTALSAPFTELAAPKKKPVPRASEPAVKQNSSATQPQEIKPEAVHTEPSVPSLPENEFLNNVEADVILNTVLNPLKTNFNFLQDSHVGPSSSTAVPSLVSQPPISMSHALPQVHENIQHHSQQVPRMDSNIPQGAPLTQPPMHQPPQLDQPRHLENTRHEHEIQPQQIAMHSKHPDEQNETFAHAEPLPQQVSHSTQQPQAQVENTQQQEQMQLSLDDSDAAKHTEKPADVPKKSKAKRGKPAVPAEPPSKTAVISAEHVQEEVKPSKPKTWADLVRGSAAEPVSSSPTQPPVFEQVSTPEPVLGKPHGHEDDVTQDRGQRPVYGRENGNWAPRGGFRGGRGRGAGPGFRGGRGRGSARGSFQPNNQRGDFHTARPSQIQSAC